MEVKTKVKLQKYVRMGPTRVPGDVLLIHTDRELKGRDWAISPGNRLHESTSHALSPDFPWLQGFQSPTPTNVISAVCLVCKQLSTSSIASPVGMCAVYLFVNKHKKKQRQVGNSKTEKTIEAKRAHSVLAQFSPAEVDWGMFQFVGWCARGLGTNKSNSNQRLYFHIQFIRHQLGSSIKSGINLTAINTARAAANQHEKP